jgi:type VI secretion system protein ImpA
MIDFKELAKPLAGDKPAGENMEYDQSYLELETLAAGQGVAEGEGPDWKGLAKNCQSLWGKTRDLRVAAYLTIAETALGGVKELAAGLQLINFLVKDMWDTVYPLLDPDDDNDPTERINIFATLSPEMGAMNDPIMFINRLRETKLMPPLPYTIRELLIAQGEIEPLDGQSTDLNLIIGELLSIPLPKVTEQAKYAKTVKELIETICKEANGKMTGGNTLAMTTLAKEIDKLNKFFNDHLKSVAPASEIDEAGKETLAENTEVPEGEAKAAPVVAPGLKTTASGMINIASYKPAARSDALLLLKKVIEYYQTMEPNSPIPFLLDRALRMAQMNFLELLEDMAPEALPRGKDILGAGIATPKTPASLHPAPPTTPTPTPNLPSVSTPAAEPQRIPRIQRTPRTA